MERGRGAAEQGDGVRLGVSLILHISLNNLTSTSLQRPNGEAKATPRASLPYIIDIL